MHNSIVQITDNNSFFLGTGFVIDKNEKGIFIATCGHVINNCKEDIFVDGKIAKIIDNRYDMGLDLAILYVDNLFLEPLIVSKNKSSDIATVIGYSKLLNNSKKEPIENIAIKHNIELSTPNKIDIIKLHTKESIANGYSGSPVICQNTKEVIGIVNIQQGDNTNYAICSRHLLDIYPINKKGEKSTKQIITKIKLSTEIDNIKYNIIKNNFEKSFEKSLESFSGLPKIWIKPRIHTKVENSNNTDEEDTKVDINDIINNPQSTIIKAREQYGLTTLSHYLVKEAWNNKENPSFWLRFDANKLKPHTKEIEKDLKLKLEDFGLEYEDIECIILDEFSNTIKDANKLLNKINEFFHDKPIIVMYTVIDNPFLNETINLPANRNFNILHLWALPRNDIRQVVINYNNEKHIGEENAVINKIVTDLDVLNIPRTAINCLTILKISEYGFDDSPVNRTEMLTKILSLLFNVENIPRYKTRPDLKDTEYTLGYLCELMIRNDKYYFTRNDFLENLNNFCKDMEIDLEIDVIFDILHQNNIIVERGNEFCFKFSYWFFYFAAQRMHKNKEFADFILQDMNYASYPELIEFYTGIERNRDDALTILTNDIKNTCTVVKEKCGLPEDFNIYDLLEWRPNEEKVKEMNDEVTNGVLNSNFPDTVKDEYADKSYNKTRHLNQNIYKILEEYSLLRLMKSISACSKALRNSDYSTPEIKHNLLNEIIKSWEQVSKVLLVLSPILAKQGYAILEGASFILGDYFGEDNEEKTKNIISQIPTNIVDWYKDDLFSKKMSTLLFNHIDKESNLLKKHLLNLLILTKRPRGWNNYFEKHIENEDKNSFYLYDLYLNLRAEYQFSFSAESEIKMIEKLIKIIATKHQLGIKKPSKKIINKIDKKNGYEKIIPKREVDF